MTSIRQRHSGKKSPVSVEKAGAFETKSSDTVNTGASALSKARPRFLGFFKDEYQPACYLLTILAFFTRFYKLNYPDEVVFDEVHFGKFAAYYIQHTYFFDLHPPFAKLLIALVGSLVGFDGEFKFDNIGSSYIENQVPYVALRALSATIGALTIPVIFKTLQECHCTVWSCILGTSLILFDNAHVAETRLILLDGTLILSMAMSLYCYVRFYKQRRNPYSRKWWKWLLATGIWLSCVISTKYVGTFAFVTVGLAVVVDLWNLLDYRVGLSLPQFSKHFGARFICLIVIPFLIFLHWFYIHLAVLSHSGPGDNFMSPAFQQTLGDNIMAKEARQINYYDQIIIKHKQTGAYLHSHEDRYPLRYEDGRVSSQGQQVTGYGHPDENNIWQILPQFDFPEDNMLGHPVTGGEIVRMRHVATNTLLYTHDVASPWYPTNEEFTTIAPELTFEDEAKRNYTYFQVNLQTAKRDPFKTKAGLFYLRHVATKVNMFCQDEKPLPDWGHGQLEVNGNKAAVDTGNVWFVEDIVGLTDVDRLNPPPKQTSQMSFISKYIELQGHMFAQNNALTASHPYASTPITWPFLIRGVSFWTHSETRRQIYFIGNFFGWWFEDCMIAIFVGLVIADQLTRRRNFLALDERARSKLYDTIGFFFIAWAAHYFPFFLMGRQLFLHHYLPAHYAAALLSGTVVDFVFGEFDEDVEDKRKRNPNKRVFANKKLIAFVTIALVLTIGTFVFVAPLTYGYPSLTPEQVQARQILSIELHFAK